MRKGISELQKEPPTGWKAKLAAFKETCLEYWKLIREKLEYTKWELKSQIVVTTCGSLVLVMIFLIASINANLSEITESTLSELTLEMTATE